MAKTFTAPFPQTPKTGLAIVTAAGSFDTSAPTNTVLLGTVGADGAMLTKLSALPRATNSAMNLFLFGSKDGGTTKHLLAVKYAPAVSVGSNSSNWTAFDFGFSDLNALRLEAGMQLYVSMGVALTQGMVFMGCWTDY